MTFDDVKDYVEGVDDHKRSILRRRQAGTERHVQTDEETGALRKPKVMTMWSSRRMDFKESSDKDEKGKKILMRYTYTITADAANWQSMPERNMQVTVPMLSIKVVL